MATDPRPDRIECTTVDQIAVDTKEDNSIRRESQYRCFLSEGDWLSTSTMDDEIIFEGGEELELETSQQGQEEEGMDSRESEPGEIKGILESGKTGQGNNSESHERTSSEANWLFSVIELEVEIYDIEEEIKQRPGINLCLEAERARLVTQLEALEQKTPYCHIQRKR